jgi:hypothetical protein
VKLRSNWTSLTITEWVAVDLRDGHDPPGGAGNKHFVRLPDFFGRDISSFDREVEHLTHFDDSSARNTLEHSSPGCGELALLNNKEVETWPLDDISLAVA